MTRRPKRRHQNSRKHAKENSYPAHLQWVRGRYTCLCSGLRVAPDYYGCLGNVQTHHVRRDHDDRCVVPLCAGHHDEIHTSGRDTFGEKYGLSHVKLEQTAADLWMESPHGKRARRLERERESEDEGATLGAG